MAAYLITNFAIMMGQPIFCNVTSGHMEVKQTSFATAIARCYMVIHVEYDLSQKLHLKAVAIASS